MQIIIETKQKGEEMAGGGHLCMLPLRSLMNKLKRVITELNIVEKTQAKLNT